MRGGSGSSPTGRPSAPTCARATSTPSSAAPPIRASSCSGSCLTRSSTTYLPVVREVRFGHPLAVEGEEVELPDARLRAADHCPRRRRSSTAKVDEASGARRDPALPGPHRPGLVRRWAGCVGLPRSRDAAGAAGREPPHARGALWTGGHDRGRGHRSGAARADERLQRRPRGEHRLRRRWSLQRGWPSTFTRSRSASTSPAPGATATSRSAAVEPPGRARSPAASTRARGDRRAARRAPVRQLP